MATAWQDHFPGAQQKLLPTNKSDTTAIAHLNTLGVSVIAPLVPRLLEWVQDINWPVAEPVIALLRKYPPITTEPLRQILRGNDGAWKANCLEYLVKHWPMASKKELREEIERIARRPTQEEKDEEADEVAGEILDEVGDKIESKENANLV